MGIQTRAKKFALFIDGYFDKFLNAFSRRKCFACNEKTALEDNGFFCQPCFTKLEEDNFLRRKFVFFTMQELDGFFDAEIFHYPKIFYFHEYGELSKKIMRYFKYRKPHYISFWRDVLKKSWANYAKQILLAGDSFDGLEKISSLDKHTVFWINPIPMNTKKLEKRVYNQADLLCDAFIDMHKPKYPLPLQTKQGLKLISNYSFKKCQLLQRNETESLFDKSKQERLEIMKCAFALDKLAAFDYNKEDLHVLLVLDDISTTGATFLAAHKTLDNIGYLFEDIIFLALTGAGQS